MRVLAGLVLLCFCAPGFAGDLAAPAEELVFLEMDAEPATPWVNQPFRLILRVGVERTFAETNLVPLFNRRMDLPLHLRAPWIDDLPGVQALADRGPDIDAERLTLAVNDDVSAAVRVADREVDGREFTVVEIRRELRAVRPGEIRLAAPNLRFAYATEFVKDFISGERPKNRRDLTVTGKPLPIDIKALPEEGRPANFTGAVGEFTITTGANLTQAEVDEQVKLTLTIEGRGNLADFDTPDLGDLPGFHALGAIDDHGAVRRTVVYDLIVMSGAAGGIPAIDFPFFDPGPPAAYRTAMSEPIPLELAPVAGPPAAGSTPRPPDDEPTLFQLASLLLSLVTIAYAVSVLLRRRARARSRSDVDPEELRAREAAAAVRTAAARPDADLAGAFTAYLARRLHCAPAGVISPDLQDRLVAAGVPGDPAARAAALVESLVAANYGGGAAHAATGESVSALVHELESVFSRP